MLGPALSGCVGVCGIPMLWMGGPKGQETNRAFPVFQDRYSPGEDLLAPELKILLIAPCIEFPNISPNCWGAKAQESREPVRWPQPAFHRLKPFSIVSHPIWT